MKEKMIPEVVMSILYSRYIESMTGRNVSVTLPYLKEVFSADIDYLNEALDSINKNYKSLDNFIINILEVDVDKLKEMYLEK